MQTSLAEQYRTLHQNNPRYGDGVGPLKNVREMARSIGASRILDFGCGKGALVKRLCGEFDIEGYDPGTEDFDKPTLLKSTYDMVLSIDVLEHCPPGTIKPELTTIRDLATGGVYLVISCRLAAAILPDGRNAHLSVHPPGWWNDRVLEVFSLSVWDRVSSFDAENEALHIELRRRDDVRQIERAKMLGPDTLDLNCMGEGHKIAVVGNGPIHKDDRKHIDDATIVIRFNDWNRRKDYDEQLAGDVVDFLFTQMDISDDPDKRAAGGDDPDVCVAIPYPFHCDAIIDKVETCFPDSQIYLFNPYSMRLICRDVLRLRSSVGFAHPIPTVGFQMLYFLWQHTKKSEGYPEIFVTGFTWHVDPVKRSIGNVPADSDNFPDTYNHSYLREAKWCAENLIGRKNFRFGRLTQESLYWTRWFTDDQKFEEKFHEGSNWRSNEEKWAEAGTNLTPIIEQIMNTLDPDEDTWIDALDVGSGPRSMLEFFREVHQKTYVHLIDPLHDRYRAMGKLRVQNAGWKVDARPGERMNHEFTGKKDLVWCHNALDHCYSYRQVLDNILLYLRSGGVAYIGTDTGGPRHGHLGIDGNLKKELQSRFSHVLKMPLDPSQSFIRQHSFICIK